MSIFAPSFLFGPHFVDNNFWRRDVEDNAYVIMKNDSGVVAMLHSSATQWRHKFTLEITLENACLVLSGILSSTKSYGQEILIVSEIIGIPAKEPTASVEVNNLSRTPTLPF